MKTLTFAVHNFMAAMPHTLAVTLPSSMETTINNFMTAGQIIGGCLAGFFIVVAGIQFMTGGRNAVETGKVRIVCTIVGMVMCAGCSVIKAFISGLCAF